MDRVTKEKRSEIMSKIRGKNTTPELMVRRLVYSLGYRYRLYDKSLPGRPDLVFKGRKKVIFVHGCFWHYHGCKKGLPPKTKLEYWLPKLSDNKKRDEANITRLRSMGWDVFVIWQCQIKELDNLKKAIIDFLSK